MMKPTINIYCDESCHLQNDKEPVMVIGAVYCPIEKKEEIFERLYSFKVKHNLIPKNKKNDNEINMLFIGRLDYQKGYDILLSAMEKTTNKDIRLTVVGSANDEGDEYKESINIKYMGWISPKEIDAFYKKSDIIENN